MLLQYDLNHIHKVSFYPSNNNFTQALLVLPVTNMISADNDDDDDGPPHRWRWWCWGKWSSCWFYKCAPSPSHSSKTIQYNTTQSDNTIQIQSDCGWRNATGPRPRPDMIGGQQTRHLKSDQRSLSPQTQSTFGHNHNTTSVLRNVKFVTHIQQIEFKIRPQKHVICDWYIFATNPVNPGQSNFVFIWFATFVVQFDIFIEFGWT